MRKIKIRIRTLEMQDVNQVCELEKSNFSQPWTEFDFKEAISNSKRIYLVAQKEETIVGICGLFQILEEGEISNVAILEKYRQQGIAFRMLQKLIEIAEQKGTTSFTLEVRESNEAAIALYEKLGFIKEGIRPAFYSFPTENAVIMWKR